MTLKHLVSCTAALACAVVLSGCHSKASTPAATSSAAGTATVPQQAVVPSKEAGSGSTANAPAAQAEQRPSGPVRFEDVTSEAGIHFRHHSGAFGKKYLPETMGSGVCAIDYDNDGFQDLLFVNSSDWPEHHTAHTTPALYHNNGNGTFTDVTAGSGLAVDMYGMGCAVGDFDNDGKDDVYITGVGGNRLFRNLGNGKFADVTAKAGVGDTGYASGAVWFDYDRDGKLDLYVGHYVDWTPQTDQNCSLDGTHKSYCTPEAYKGQSAKLFHNLGNGRFEEVSKKAGVADATSKSLGVAIVDYDNDGWPDLFVTNDTQPDKLYRNNHNGTFTESGFSAGVSLSDAGKARAGMGTDAADWDGSGRPGLVIGNFTNESIALYRNEGGGLFTEQSAEAGIASPSAKSLTFSTFFFDYDLDGLPDIFALNGHVADDIRSVQPTLSYPESPLLFRNRGGGHFENVTDRVGSDLRKPVVGRGAAYLDYDLDGDLDLVVTTSNGPAKLFRNDNGNANDVLRVKTIGTKSNRDGIGAVVTVHLPNGKHVTQMVKSGSSYLSQSELPLTFGLGKPVDGKVVSVDIVWPSGRKESVKSVAANQFLTLEEGRGVVAQKAIQVGSNAK